MGLLDGIASEIMKGVVAEIETQGVPAVLSKVLGNTQFGSIGGLLQHLQQGGLGSQVASWLGSGPNQPVSADQLRDALGNDQLVQMARNAGVPVDELLKLLAQHLPGAVDQMSPHGKLQEPAGTDDSGDAAKDDDTKDDAEADNTPDAEADDQAGGGSLADDAGLKDLDRR